MVITTNYLPFRACCLAVVLACATLGCADPGPGRGMSNSSSMPDSSIPEPGTSLGGSGNGPAPSTVVPENCGQPVPPRSPLRRLTHFEYSNTIEKLLGDSSSPGSGLPAEQSGNGFGNDADQQPVSTLLAQRYIGVAQEIAGRATSPTSIGALAPCVATLGSSPTPSAERTCVDSFISSFAPRAYRRPLEAGEAEELGSLFDTLRVEGDFSSGVAGVLQAVLLTPEFLYRPEFGVPVPGRPDLLRPTGYEMATRLSYFYWGTMPDPALTQAAAAGELDTAEGVLTHATRMLTDPRAETSLRFFFDKLLPISSLSSLPRDLTLYPTFTAEVASFMREETQTFLRHVIFEGGGNFDAIFTAPYTFVNGALAQFYGYPAVEGAQFQKVSLGTTRRLGILTQGSVMAGTTPSNHTNPVKRGAFVMEQLLCQHIPPPGADLAALITPPDPYGGATARERFAAHSQQPVCAACHSLMDPIGLALENLDAIGRWRDTENGEPIDASGQMQVLGAAFNGAAELSQRIAATDQAKTCFSSHVMNYAYGRTLRPADRCTVESVQSSFARSGYDVRSLLSAVSQSDAFLYLSAVKE